MGDKNERFALPFSMKPGNRITFNPKR